MENAIAITGATGFIGGALIKRLASSGRPIQALIRPGSFHKKPVDGMVKWIRGDLDDRDSLNRLVHGAEAIIHCAGTVRGVTRNDFNRINVDGVARLAQAAVNQPQPPRFLLMSSLAAREPRLSAYASSKHQGEMVLAKTASSIDWTALRPPAVYGPDEKEMMPVLRWMARGFALLPGSGNCRFPLLYVEDLAEAVIQWLDQRGGQRRSYELHDGHSAGYSWHEVIETIAGLRGGPVAQIRVPLVMIKPIALINLAVARVLGYAPMLTPGKIREIIHPDWTVDNTAICKSTGWSPKIDLAEGLRRTLGLGQRTDNR